MKKKTSKTEPAPNGAQITTILSVAELQQRIIKPIDCMFLLDGEAIKLPVRRLTPSEEAAIRAIAQELGPPPFQLDDKGKPTGEYNYADAKYLARNALLKGQERSMRIYTGCKVVQDGQPGLKDRAAVHAYVSGLFTENILEIIDGTIQLGGTGVIERVNFPSTPASEN